MVPVSQDFPVKPLGHLHLSGFIQVPPFLHPPLHTAEKKIKKKTNILIIGLKNCQAFVVLIQMANQRVSTNSNDELSCQIS